MNLRVSADVRACDLGPAVVLVSYRTGAVQLLTGPSAGWWRTAARSGDVERSAPVVARLLANKMVEEGSAERWPLVDGVPWEANWGTNELPMGFEPHPRAPIGAHLLAVLGLGAVITVAVCGRRRYRMRRLLGLVRLACRTPARPATYEETERVVHAVRRIGMFSPLRVACLEQSVAATIGLALVGCRVRWCHGVSADPITLHAWVEAENRPVAEADSIRRCALMLALPPKENT